MNTTSTEAPTEEVLLAPASERPTAATDRHRRVDDRIGLLGDPHADYQWTKVAIRALHRAGIRQVHVLGDFGFLTNGNPYERDKIHRLTEQLISRDMVMYITEGNHEGYPTLHKFYPRNQFGYRHLSKRIMWLPRGWRGATVAGTVVASLGGANSIGRDSRDPAVHGQVAAWHTEEQITKTDLEALGTEPVDVLLGHDAPFSKALKRRSSRTGGAWTKEGIAYAEAGQAMFHRAVVQVRPKLVLSGHYHRFLDTSIRLRTDDAEESEVRSVILARNRSPHSVAILEPDALRLNLSTDLSPRLT